MARYLTLTNSKITTLGRKKKTISSPIFVGPVSFRFILVAILSILGLIYIKQSNEASLKGYQIGSLEEQKEQLILENEGLNVEAARLKSLSAIDAEKLELVPPQKVDYLPAQSPVAIGK